MNLPVPYRLNVDHPACLARLDLDDVRVARVPHSDSEKSITESLKLRRA